MASALVVRDTGCSCSRRRAARAATRAARRTHQMAPARDRSRLRCRLRRRSSSARSATDSKQTEALHDRLCQRMATALLWASLCRLCLWQWLGCAPGSPLPE